MAEQMLRFNGTDWVPVVSVNRIEVIKIIEVKDKFYEFPVGTSSQFHVDLDVMFDNYCDSSDPLSQFYVDMDVMFDNYNLGPEATFEQIITPSFINYTEVE